MIYVKCPWCPKTFYRRCSMTTHITVQHGQYFQKSHNGSVRQFVKKLFNQ